MAFATEMTIGITNKVSREEEGVEAALCVRFDLEQADTDLLALAQEKGNELAQMHRSVLSRLQQDDNEEPAPPVSPVWRPTSPPPVPEMPQSSPAPTVPASAGDESAARNGSKPDRPGAPAVPDPSSPRGSLPQKLAIVEVARRLGRSEAQLSGLVRGRFGKAALSQLSRAEAATLLSELQRGQWNLAPAARAA